MRINTRVLSALMVFAVILPAPPASSQQGGDEVRNGALRVFLECAARGCESSHFRTEITYVNWVIDVRDSQLHVIMTSQGTGSGDEFLMDFIGREELEGTDDQLSYAHSDTDADFQRLRGLTSVLAVGLARYSVMAGYGGPFSVVSASGEIEVPDLPPGLQGDVDDPWDYWVFRLGGNVNLEGESKEDSYRFSGNLSANRTTELWKISVNARGSFSRREVETSDTTIYVDERDDWSTDGRIFYSLAERWSAGFEAGASSSTRNNQDLGGQVGTGVEYSFFPYRDWTRKRMTLQALIYARYYNYEEETIYGKDTETVWESSLRWGLGLRQPWGQAYFNATAEAFLHNPRDFYRLSAGGSLSFRILRGLEWEVSGNVAKIRDQIFLSAEGIPEEEILVQRRQLPTDFEFRISTGLSFTFGSIFNNVVNNRFGFVGGGRGGGRFFF
jgi:hypothetical protein